MRPGAGANTLFQVTVVSIRKVSAAEIFDMKKAPAPQQRGHIGRIEKTKPRLT
jgi:hypothetical protein